MHRHRSVGCAAHVASPHARYYTKESGQIHYVTEEKVAARPGSFEPARLGIASQITGEKQTRAHR